MILINLQLNLQEDLEGKENPELEDLNKKMNVGTVKRKVKIKYFL